MEEYEPRKGLYQIYIVKKSTGNVILDKKVIAFSEGEALRKVPTGQILGNLKANEVELYIRVAGYLYEGVFDKDLVARE